MTLSVSWGLDVYRVVLFPLITSGTLKGGIDAPSGEVAYEGIEITGPQSVELNFGAPRSVANISQAQVNDTISLPSTDPKTAVLRCSYDSQALNALLTQVNVTTVGAAKVIEEGTDREGEEIQCGMFVQQLVTHDEAGLVIWRTELFPRATLVPQPTNFTDAAIIKQYDITLGASTKRLWGETLSLVTHGCVKAVKSQVLSNDKFNIVAWYGDADCLAASFLLPTDKPGKNSSSAKVWNWATGAEEAGTWDSATVPTEFTPTDPIDDPELFVCTYEW